MYDWGVGHIHCCDYRDFLRKLPPGCADLVVTDLPWGVTPQKWDKRPNLRLLAVLLAETLSAKGQAWFFVRMPWAIELHSAMTDVGFKYFQEVIWEKQNAGGCTVKTWRKVHENIWHYVRPGADVFNLRDIREPKRTQGDKSVKRRASSTTQFMTSKGSSYTDDGMRMPRSVRFCRNTHRSQESVGHPTQKPLGVVEPLILYSSKPGQVVLDPFAGSFTTAEAAERTGRRWLACDSNPDYCRLGEARVRAAREGGCA